jgi:hypothetical protein
MRPCPCTNTVCDTHSMGNRHRPPTSDRPAGTTDHGPPFHQRWVPRSETTSSPARGERRPGNAALPSGSFLKANQARTPKRHPSRLGTQIGDPAFLRPYRHSLYFLPRFPEYGVTRFQRRMDRRPLIPRASTDRIAWTNLSQSERMAVECVRPGAFACIQSKSRESIAEVEIMPEYMILDNDSDKLDFLRKMLSPFDVRSAETQLRFLRHVLVEMPTIWSIVDGTEVRPEFAKLWADRYGEWDHCRGRTRDHNQLGMAYAWWALHEHAVFSEISLSDSPDIRAVMLRSKSDDSLREVCTVQGDIGRCTPLAICNALQGALSKIHDLWISVLDWRTHVVVEFNYSPSAYCHKRWHDYSPDVALKKIFFCETCHAWTIDEASRKRALRTWGKKTSHTSDPCLWGPADQP